MTRFCRPIAERLATHSVRNPETGCLEWTGSKTRAGYGKLNLSNGATRLAHRLSFELSCGPLTPGLYVCHSCDNRCCIEPTHLFQGTAAENMQDMHRKGRAGNQVGEANSQVRLTREDVEAVRRASGSQREVAERFGVSQSHISRIRTGVRRSNEAAPS